MESPLVSSGCQHHNTRGLSLTDPRDPLLFVKNPLVSEGGIIVLVVAVHQTGRKIKAQVQTPSRKHPDDGLSLMADEESSSGHIVRD